MVPPKVFLTGVTGFVGGDGLYAIANAHPDWQLSTLVRNKDKAAKLVAQYPNIRVVHGDLDSVDIIEEEVGNADIVFHYADADHVAAATAISRGAQRHVPEQSVWIIHTSGTGILCVEDMRARSFGIERHKEYNDWDGVGELLNMPPDALHRNVDEIIINSSKLNPASVKTAIVCPPVIYGSGRGPCSQKSRLASLSVAVLQLKKGFLVGPGQNVWHQVHVQDLTKLFLTLGDAAAAGGGGATWNDENYYLAENGSFVFGDIQRAVTKAAFEKNLIPSPNVEQLDDAQIMKLISEGYYGFYGWGSNSRGHAIRARKLFGWNPTQPKMIDLVPSIVELEAKDLGLL